MRGGHNCRMHPHDRPLLLCGIVQWRGASKADVLMGACFSINDSPYNLITCASSYTGLDMIKHLDAIVQTVQRTVNRFDLYLCHMQVHHRGHQISMPQQMLYAVYIYTIFQSVCSITVT